jgi:N-acetylglucosaminyldiphosphoundecaprenol N-acetyl-beta-D-mannosaminyltransferase
MNKVFKRSSILGVRVDAVSLNELISYIVYKVQLHEKAIITNVNVHAVNIAYKVSWFRDFINNSQVVFCDGYGIKWAVNFLNRIKLYRLTPPDWFGNLAAKCVTDGYSLFLLGSTQEVVDKAAAEMQRKYPLLRILGTHHGYFDKQVTSSENKDVITRINALNPDILMVGFGMPTQEKWILENWDELMTTVILPVGALFDYLSGEVRRVPRWMTDHGLEWLGRMIIEPKRLWRRYLIGNPLFTWRIFKHHILRFSLPSN